MIGSTDEILEQLNEQVADDDFPMLNNAYLRNADIRLTSFRSQGEWLLIFQEIAVSEQHGFINLISAYGNCIVKPGTQRIELVVQEPNGTDIWDENGQLRLNKWDFTLTLRNQLRHFTPTSEDYADAGVDLNSDVPEAVQILRLLAAQIPDDLFLPDDQLLSICGRSEAGLSKFLQLEGWQHPDRAENELPSQSPCLRSLAHALAQNDPELYTCPEEIWNTHWSNWDAYY